MSERADEDDGGGGGGGERRGAERGSGHSAATSQGHNPWLLTVIVTAAAFMEVLDTTIVNVALPHIAGSLASSQDESTWTLTSYLVANGIVLPISGWLSTLFGRKRYFITCILAFTGCSVLCGFATSLPQLVVFRVLQGLFGGGLQPSQQAILLDLFPVAQRGRAFSVVAIATVVGPVIGPTLGGWITDSYSWRWIFFVNVPVGLLAAFLISRMLGDPPSARAHPEQARRIDYPGIALIALGLGCLQIFLDRGEDADWFHSDFIRLFATLCALGLIGAVLWLSVARNPVVDLRLFRNRNFAVGCLLIFVLGCILYAGGVMVPQLVQQQFGYTAKLAGFVIAPGAIVVAMLLPLVGFLMGHISGRTLIVLGFLALGLGALSDTDITPGVSFAWMVRARIEMTFGIGFLFAPISVSATASLRPEENGAGAALFTMARNVGGSVGTSVLTAEIARRTQVHWAYLTRHLTPLSSGFNLDLAHRATALLGYGRALAQTQSQAHMLLYQALMKQSSLLGYMDGFRYIGIAALLVVPLGLLVSRRVGGGAGAA